MELILLSGWLPCLERDMPRDSLVLEVRETHQSIEAQRSGARSVGSNLHSANGQTLVLDLVADYAATHATWLSRVRRDGPGAVRTVGGPLGESNRLQMPAAA